MLRATVRPDWWPGVGCGDDAITPLRARNVALVYASVVNRRKVRRARSRSVPVRALRVAAAVAVAVSLSGAGWGCSQAGDSVTAERDRVRTRATPTSPLPARSSSKVTNPTVTSAPATSTPALAAPVTSGGNGGGAVISPTRTGSPSPTTPVPITGAGPTAIAPTTTLPVPPPPVPLGEVSVSSVACGGHDDGDWVVFRLDGMAVNTSAGYGTSPVAMAGDGAVVVTLTPAFDRVTSDPTYSGCRYVMDIQRAGSAAGTVSWVIGVRGQPRITTVQPGPAGSGYAYVVKLQT